MKTRWLAVWLALAMAQFTGDVIADERVDDAVPAGGGRIATIGLDSQEFERALPEKRAAGYRLVELSGYAIGDQARFAAVWEQARAPEWEVRHGLDSHEYDEAGNEMADKGYRLTELSGYAIGGEARYAGLWEKRDGPEQASRHGLDAKEYQEALDEMKARGFRLARVDCFGLGHELRYAAIWIKADGPAQEERHGLDSKEFQQALDEMAAKGYRLLDLAGAGLGGQARWAAVWEKAPCDECKTIIGMDAQELRQALADMAGQGYRLLRFNAYGLGHEARFAAVWEKTPK